MEDLGDVHRHLKAIDRARRAADAEVLTLAQLDRLYAVAVIRLHGGNKSAASRALGISAGRLCRILARST